MPFIEYYISIPGKLNVKQVKELVSFKENLACLLTQVLDSSVSRVHSANNR